MTILRKISTCILFIFLLFFKVAAQNNSGKVFGFVKDAQSSEPMTFASVALIQAKDFSIVKGVITDKTGRFTISSVPFGNYFIKISFVGYDDLKSEIFILNDVKLEKNFGLIKLKRSVTNLKELTIAREQIRVEQKGDTIQYNSNAYKTNPDATTEDLVAKMPGITTDNSGNLKAHGEQVKQVLVDGKPFFGDDPSMALKNLPAEVVDKIQIFDKLSDQSQFTGFDDGQTTKTMNIITKNGKNNGQFGKVYAGYGADDHYIAGGNVNLFKGERRISVIGLSNNINQQNFSSQDLLGVTGNSAGGQGRGGGVAGRGGFSGGGGGGGFGSNQANNFLIGTQAGVSTTNSIGLNYSDKWGKKMKVTGSYFFNNTENTNYTSLTRNYFTLKNQGLIYNEYNQSDSRNYNHRINFRFEYELDSLNKLTFTPKLNFQQKNASATVWGSNIFPENSLENKTENSNKSNNFGYTFSNNILYQHKFKKRGRTFSMNIETNANDKNGKGSLYSLNQYINDTTLIDQHSTQNNNGYTIASGINYTEPIDSNNQIQFNYNPSFIKNKTDKETENFDMIKQDYLLMDTALSNKYQNTYFSNRGGISYRRNGKKNNFMIGVNYQYATLSGNEIFPVAFHVRESYHNLLPNAMYNYKFDKGTNIRFMYRTSTNIPSISQLQNVVNNTNPLLLSTGNPDLKQDYEHTLIVRYGRTKSEKATGLFIFLYGNYAQNYIGNSTFIAPADTIWNKNIVLKKGSQLTQPVNLNDCWNTRGIITYAIPFGLIKCNLNMNGGFTYNKTPSLINHIINLTNNYTMLGGLGLSSNINEKIDFNLSYTANYNMVDNSIQTQSNTNYFYHIATLKLNWIFWKGFVLNTNVNQTYYAGLSQNFNQNFLLWNGSLGYKFLKNQSLELKFSVFDILNQNKSITRNVTDTYIEDNQTKVLNRYYLFTLTYNMKKFKQPANTKQKILRH